VQTTLAALAVLTAGYILAYLLFDRLRDRYGYVGGAEYVLLGVLLGPHVTGLLDARRVQDLTPIVSLAIGWLGMLLGTSFRLPALALLPPDHVRMAFGEAIATFVAALGPLLLLFRYLAGDGWTDAAVQAVTLAAVATLSSPAAVDALVARARRRPSILGVLQLTARIDALIGVVAFGLVLAIVHRGDVAPGIRPPTATEWAVIFAAYPQIAAPEAEAPIIAIWMIDNPRARTQSGSAIVAVTISVFAVIIHAPPAKNSAIIATGRCSASAASAAPAAKISVPAA